MRALIIDRFPESFRVGLDSLPIDYTYLPHTNRAEVLSIIADYEILIMNSKVRADQELADTATKLGLVVRAGVGMDHIDIPYLESKGIAVHNTAGANADSVGEQTVGMLLALRHSLMRANRQVKAFQWEREVNRGVEIKGKTVGIIGYGNTGQAVSNRLAGFGCRRLVYDKYVSGFGSNEVEEVQMEQIFAEADVLTLHIPLTAETQQLVNDEYLSRFAKPIMLLNLARGPIVDINALNRALDSGKVIAAALDVLPNEKLHTLSEAERTTYETLFQRENVMLAPHIGGWSVESLDNINQRILGIVRAFIGT
ncbi:MAG: NAD(P)-dependent oxidoreductase [Bacteroidota bacterium]